MPQYPSERQQSGRKARVRAETFTVWKCRNCGQEFNYEPSVGVWTGSKCCGSKLGFRKSRVKA